MKSKDIIYHLLESNMINYSFFMFKNNLIIKESYEELYIYIIKIIR